MKNLPGLIAIVADRHLQVRSWLRDQLALLGITSVSQAHNSNDLMRKVQNQHFDVVLCDHHLDDRKDGEEILSALRANKMMDLKTVFIIITSHNEPHNVVIAAEFAPDDYILKPFTADLLGHRIEEALKKKRAFADVYVALAQDERDLARSLCDKLATTSYRLDALRLKAELYALDEMYEEASAIYKVVAATRSVPWARLGYAWMLLFRGKVEQALEVGLALNEERPEYITVYDFLSEANEALGDVQAAITYKERAAAITKGDVRRMRTIIRLADTSNDWETKARYLKRVVSKTRGRGLEVKDFLHLNTTLLKLDRLTEAEQHVLSNASKVTGGANVVKAVTAAATSAIQTARDPVNAVLSLEEAIKYNNLDLKTEVLNMEIIELADKLDRQDLVEHMIPKPELDIEWVLQNLSYKLETLTFGWEEDTAKIAREHLVTAFTIAPRDRRVVDAHIKYNSLATRYGVSPHRPTAAVHKELQ